MVKTSNKSKLTIKLIIVVVCILIIGTIVYFATKKEDYYSAKYYDEYGWYTNKCTDSFGDMFEATTWVFCDCGWYEFHNTYGSKSIFGENLSVADVQGMGSTIKNDKLADNIKVCYDSEVAEYEKNHPNVDLDAMWKNGKKMIMPKRAIEAGEK